MHRYVRSTVAAVVSVALCGATPGFAQSTHTVELAGTSFTPDTLTIQLGDTVHWVWISGSHNVVSGVDGTPDGNFQSGDPATGATFDVTFDEAFLNANPMANNEYPYYCQVHWGLGMTATITVAGGVPAVSGWGLAVIALLMLAAATVILTRRKARHHAG